MEETPIKKLLLHHLHRNRVKDQLVAIDEEITLHERQLINLRKKLKSGGRKVNKLDRLKKISLFQSKTKEDLERAQQVESNAYDSYEGKLNQIKELKEERAVLVDEFRSFEKVKERLEDLVDTKILRLKGDVDFTRKLNILKHKRKRLSKYKAIFEKISSKIIVIRKGLFLIQKDIELMSSRNMFGSAYSGEGALSSYKKKQLLKINKQRLFGLIKEVFELKSFLKKTKIDFDPRFSLKDIETLLTWIFEHDLALELHGYEAKKKLKIILRKDEVLERLEQEINKKEIIIYIGNRQIDRERMFFIIDY